MAIKKSERYSSLWTSCDELRCGMDASQYEDYVLVDRLTNLIKKGYIKGIIGLPANLFMGRVFRRPLF